MRKVEVHPYNENWPSMFLEEANKLKLLFGELIVDIHHIGSTAVLGLKAKPIIDIMPVVKDIQLVDQYNLNMQALGYEPKGENGIKGRRYFKKGGDDRTHHVHIYEIGSFELKRHLAFRDFLRTHTNIKEQYGDLKERLAYEFPDDIESYIRGKEDLAIEIERQALDWYTKLEIR